MSTVIDTLIFDRTNSDLEKDTDKAYISYADLNRVENACKYLADLFGVSIETKTWLMSDFRTESEMERIRSNILLLKKSFYDLPGATDVPNAITYINIKQANDIEKILYELNAFYEDILSGKKRFSFKIGNRPLGNRR